MMKSFANKDSGFWKSIEERALSKKLKEQQKKQHVPYLDEDCISNILIRLPLGSLQRSRFVCKLWYSIINSPVFIDAHFLRSQSVLIFLKPVPNESRYPYFWTSTPPEQPKTFSVEASFCQSDPLPISWRSTISTAPKFSIQFIEFKDGKSRIGNYSIRCYGHIRATCNGLILLDNKLNKGVLVVMNPLTRKLLELPLGTIYPPHRESYGFAFSDISAEYKVVHLFRDRWGYVSVRISLTIKFKELNRAEN